MKLSQPKKLNWLYTALAFLLPTLGFCVLMLIRGFIPFGETSMLYSDMYHQYYPFFVAFRKALLSGQSLLYSWDVGMGMDYLGLIAYYLASPLNLLSVLVPEDLTLAYFSLLVPIKLGLAGGFFGIFLKHLFRKNDLSPYSVVFMDCAHGPLATTGISCGWTPSHCCPWLYWARCSFYGTKNLFYTLFPCFCPLSPTTISVSLPAFLLPSSLSATRSADGAVLADSLRIWCGLPCFPCWRSV